jgi:hypothetical protein
MCAFNSICGVLLLFPLLAVSRICSVASPCTLGVAQCSEAQFTNNCSYVFNNQRSFANQARAIAACQSKFGAASTLVTPGDLTTNNMVRNLCASHRFFDMRRRTGAGNTCLQWQTFAGEPITYFNWDNGEPSPNNCNEDCAGFRADAMGKWHDSFCTPTAGSVTFVAQCVVCAIEPTPAPTPRPTPAPDTPLPTPMPIIDTPEPTPQPTPRPTPMPAIVIMPGPTGVLMPTPPRSGKPVGTGDDVAGDGEGLAPAALGGIIGGVFWCLICCLILLVLFLRRRDKEKKQEKQLVAITQPTARYAVNRPTEIGQYGASPVPNGGTIDPFHQPPAASWNGLPEPTGMPGVSASFFHQQLQHSGMQSAMHSGFLSASNHSNSGVFMTAGNDMMFSAREDEVPVERTLPPNAYFPSAGAHYLPEPPKQRALPDPQLALQMMQQQQDVWGAPAYPPADVGPSEVYHTSSSLREAVGSSEYGAASLVAPQEAAGEYGLASLVPQEASGDYGSLSLQPGSAAAPGPGFASTYGLSRTPTMPVIVYPK